MNQQIEQSTSNLIDTLNNIVVATQQSLVTNFPDFAQQIVAAGNVSCIISIAVFTSIILATLIGIIYVFWITRDDSDDDKFQTRFMSSAASLIIIIPLFINGIQTVQTYYQIQIAPKVYVANYIIDNYIKKLQK